MRTILGASVVPILLAVVVLVTVVPVAHGAVYSTTYYDIYYFNTVQYQWARGLTPYLSRAFWAAKTTIGYDARIGKMIIYFVHVGGQGLGFSYPGYQWIYLNSPYFTSYNKWGSVVAHETTHILYYNYTRAQYWNAAQSPKESIYIYNRFLTESLAYYAGDYVYNGYTTSSAVSEIRTHLRYYDGKTKLILSWVDSAYYYTNRTEGVSDLNDQCIWQLRAIGWYLTGGRLTGSSPYLKRLLYVMRAWSSVPGWRLRSASFPMARAYFEYAFRYGYGRYSNADWYYTGSANGAYKNTSYLYGSFYLIFYP